METAQSIFIAVAIVCGAVTLAVAPFALESAERRQKQVRWFWNVAGWAWDYTAVRLVTSGAFSRWEAHRALSAGAGRHAAPIPADDPEIAYVPAADDTVAYEPVTGEPPWTVNSRGTAVFPRTKAAPAADYSELSAVAESDMVHMDQRADGSIVSADSVTAEADPVQIDNPGGMPVPDPDPKPEIADIHEDTDVVDAVIVDDPEEHTKTYFRQEDSRRLIDLLRSGDDMRRLLDVTGRFEGPWSNVKITVEDGSTERPFSFPSWPVSDPHARQDDGSLADPAADFSELAKKIRAAYEEDPVLAIIAPAAAPVTSAGRLPSAPVAFPALVG